jgi:two-component system, sensor histidine kinase and response regulator
MRILVVDDSVTLRSMIRATLEGAGYEVDEAEDGEVALRKLIANKQRYDLITLDIVMPKMDGFATCEKLLSPRYKGVCTTSQGAPIPIVFLTSNDALADRIKGFELGATNFVHKSFLEAELIPVVDRILRSEGFLKGLVALVVDDSKTYRQIIIDTLVPLGVEVDEAEDGDIAFAMIKENPSRYSLITTDKEMPYMDGLELTSKIRNDLGLHDIPVLVISSYDDATSKIALFKSGATDYITKPFIQEELLARIQVRLDSVSLNREFRKNVRLLKAANEDLRAESANRKTLVHILCHDMVTPFSSMLGALELMGMEGGELEEEITSALIDSARRGLAQINLVRQMQALDEKALTGNLTLISACEAFVEVEQALRHKLREKGVSLDVSVDDSLQVRVEPVSFVQSVLCNLISNAVKFSARGGRIWATARQDGGMVEIVLRDHGVGIPPKLLDQLFDITKKTSRKGTEGEMGTGFGMPLVQKFAKAYGGDIRVVSSEGPAEDTESGTTVILRLQPN